MASLNVESLRRKLVALQNTQDSIQTLSLWIIHHKNHYRQIVEEWMEACRNAPKSSRRLVLLYLANDVLQNSKRKGATVFLDAFAEVLEEAASLCRDEAIRKSVLRIFNIWEERNIYENDFCEKLNAATVLQKTPSAKPKPRANTKILAEYKPEEVPETIEELMRFEAETELKCKQLNNMNVDVTNTETITKLKDRAGGKQFSKQFDEAANKLEDYVQSLTKEVEMRKKLVELLDKGEIFYEAQFSEAKIVTNAYKNFGTRVSSLKKRLDEYKKLLPDPTNSPIPSPASDAPSPGATPPRDPNADTMEVEDMELSDEDGKQHGSIVAAPAKSASYKPTPVSDGKLPMPALPGNYPIPALGVTTGESYTPPGSPPSPDGSPIALSPPSITPPSLTPPEEKKKKKRSHKHRKDHKREHHHHKKSRRDRRQSSTDLYTPSPDAFVNQSSRTSTPSSKSDTKGEERVGTPVRDELDTQQNKEKLIKEATTNPIEFLTKLINKSQQSKGKKSAQSTSFINSLTVLSKNVKRLEAAKQAETNYELHKVMPLDSASTKVTTPVKTSPVKTKSPVTTGPPVLPFSVATVAESVEEDKFKDHLAAHALSVGHIMKALKEGKPSPPPPPPPPVSSMVGGFAQVTSAPSLYTSSSSAPLTYTPVATSAQGQYTPVTTTPVRFPAPNNEIQIIGEKPPEIQVIGINPPPHATGMQAPSHITGVPTGVPPPDPPPGAPGIGPTPQPVPPVSYANPPITPTRTQLPPFSAPNKQYSDYNAGPSYPQPSPGPSPGPSPDQQIQPPFLDQPVGRPPPDQNMEPLFPQQPIVGPPPNQGVRPPFSQPNVTGPPHDTRPPFPDLNMRGPAPNQDMRPPFPEPIRGVGPPEQDIRPPFSQQNITGPLHDVQPTYSEPNTTQPTPNLDIRPPFSQQNATGPSLDTSPPFSESNRRGPPFNHDASPPFTQQNVLEPHRDVRPPFTEHNIGGPPPDQDLRVPFPHQDNQISPGDQDMRPLFPPQDGSGPPQDQDMRPSFPPPDIQRPPPEQNVEPLYQHRPEHHPGTGQSFDQDMRQPYTPTLHSGDQDMRQPFPHHSAEGQHQDHDMRQINRQHSTGEQTAEQPYDPGQLYDTEQSYTDQSYSEEPYSEQSYNEQSYSEQSYSEQQYTEHYPQQSNEGHHTEHQQDAQPYDPGQPLPTDQFSADQQHHVGPPFHEEPPPDHFSEQSHHERFTGPHPHDAFSGPKSEQRYGGRPRQERHISEAAQPIQALSLSTPSRPRSILKKRKPENIISLGQSEEERPYEDPHTRPHSQHMGAPLPFHLLHAPPPPPEEPEHTWPLSESQENLPPSSVLTVPDRKMQDSHQEAQPIKVVTSSPAPVRMQRPGPPPGPPPPTAKRLSGAPPPPPGPPPAHARRLGSHESESSNRIPMTDEELTEMAHAELEQALELSDSIPRIKPSKTLVQIPLTPIFEETEIKEPPAPRPILKSALKKEQRVPLPPILKSALKRTSRLETPEEKPPVSIQNKSDLSESSAASKQKQSKPEASKWEPIKSQPPKDDKKSEEPKDKKSEPKTVVEKPISPAVKQTNAKSSNADVKVSESPKPEPTSPIPVLGNKKKEVPAVKSQVNTPPSANEKPGYHKHSDDFAGEFSKPEPTSPIPVLGNKKKDVPAVKSQVNTPPSANEKPGYHRHSDDFAGEFSKPEPMSPIPVLGNKKKDVPAVKSQVNTPPSANAKPRYHRASDDFAGEPPKPEPTSPIPVLGNKKKGAPVVKSQVNTPPSANEKPGYRRHSDDFAGGEHKRPDYNRSRSYEKPENPNVHSIETVGQRRRNYSDRPFERHRDRFEGRFDRNFNPQYGRHDNAQPPDRMNRQMGNFDRRPDRFQDRGMGREFEHYGPPGMGHEQFGRGPPPKRHGPPMMGGPPSRRQPPPFYRY